MVENVVLAVSLVRVSPLQIRHAVPILQEHYRPYDACMGDGGHLRYMFNVTGAL